MTSASDDGLAAPIIQAGPPPSGSDTNATWSFVTTDGARTECQLARDGVVLEPFTTCVSPVTYDLFPAGEGRYTFSVRALRDGQSSAATTASYELTVASEEDVTVDVQGDFDPTEILPGLAGLIDPPRGGPQGPDGPGPGPAPPSADDPSFTPAGTAAVVKRLGQLAVATAEKTAFPVALWLIMLGFLAIQDRIDRRDPKLALAPVQGEPDLDFPSTRPTPEKTDA